MHQPPKRIRRMVREYAGLAYEAELRQALLPLSEDFDRWRAGELDSSELSASIHRFHDGPARELWKSYNLGHAGEALAYAIHTGALDRALVPPELLEHLSGALSFMAREDDEEAEPQGTESTER